MENLLNIPLTVGHLAGYLIGSFILAICKGIYKGYKNSKEEIN